MGCVRKYPLRRVWAGLAEPGLSAELALPGSAAEGTAQERQLHLWAMPMRLRLHSNVKCLSRRDMLSGNSVILQHEVAVCCM